jgi:FMN phosphatase YigB (HAD superfamily)
MTTSIIYGIAAVLIFLFWLGYKMYDRLVEEIADMRDELAEERGRHRQIIQQKDLEYKSLAEARDTTKIEDTMTNIQRDLEAQFYRHEQEMLSGFNTQKSILANILTISNEASSKKTGKIGVSSTKSTKKMPEPELF